MIAADDVDAGVEQALSGGAAPPNEELPRDGRFTERSVFDPNGTRIDIGLFWKH